MFFALISFILFCITYFGLWWAWSQYACRVLPETVPHWIKKPHLLSFFFVTFFFFLFYKSFLPKDKS